MQQSLRYALWAAGLCSPIVLLAAVELLRSRQGALRVDAAFVGLSLAAALLIDAARRAFVRHLGPVVGSWLIVKPSYDSAQIDMRRERMVKHAFGFAFYGAASCAGWLVLVDKPWAPASVVWGASGSVDECWSDLLAWAPPASVRAYYALGLGHSLHQMYHQLASGERRRDFAEMMAHHVATVLLVGLSWAFGYARIGTLVLLLHDASDILVCAGRVANEAMPTSRSVWVFVAMNLAWVYARLWAFPFVLIRSTTFDAPRIAAAQGVAVEGSGYWAFNAMLWLLLALHAFWFSMFVRMGVTVALKGSVDDNINAMQSPRAAKGGLLDSPPIALRSC
eukprot:m51a1_g8898 hypothetical protein (336) ;mRNA; f:714293-715980